MTAGAALHVTDTGTNGEVVVLLHPASGSADSWIHQIDEFAAAGFRVVAYDRRGTGRSAPAEAADADSVADLRQLVEHLGVDAVHLVAAAGGGQIALAYTLVHPQQVTSLVLSGTNGGLTDADFVEVLDRCMRPELTTLPWHLSELSAGYRALHPEGVERWEAVRAAAHQGRVVVPGKLTREPITADRLMTLTTPILLLAGGADLLTPPALMRQIAQHLPRHELHVLHEVGHAAFWEAATEWNATILDFLERHRVHPPAPTAQE
ncbi:alpha/beta hydrolase [Actinoplanes sp. NBRC 103695]|uniref:alpha/beta fold hydrolase n=1 Tax=Actinoplanes sp. NBRC 103695 TaxID=3032202 RepID=UPI0024A4EF08|nr:alpha/beta hydrolase [Actinoplanes sp. NBRC 103695]GLY97200.1 alpha/beta hydrolase [Actinoplanes sp. NBRC 103695]